MSLAADLLLGGGGFALAAWLPVWCLLGAVLTRAAVDGRLTGDRGQALQRLGWYDALDAALEDPTVHVIVVWCPRQSGKTQAAVRRMVGDLLCVPHSYSVLISASREQAEAIHSRKLRLPLQRLLTAAGLPGTTIHLTQSGAVNPAIDSAVEILSANEATIPARSVTLLLLDECKSIPDRVFAAAAPSVIAAGGKIVCLSTPGAPRGFFHALATGQDPAVRVIRVDRNENPHADPGAIGFLGRLLAKVLPMARDRDLLNLFRDAGDRAIPPELWASNSEPTWSPLWPTKELGLVLALDAALTGDTVAAVAVGRDGDQLILAFHQIWRPTRAEPFDLRELEEWVLERHRQYRLIRVIADPYQMARSITALRAQGIPITEYLQTPANLTKMTGTLLEVLTSRRSSCIRATSSPSRRATPSSSRRRAATSSTRRGRARRSTRSWRSRWR